MTAPHIVDPAGVLSEALLDASPDLMRSLLQTMINALLSEVADPVLGAEWGKASPDRTAPRHGSRHGAEAPRVGTVADPLPKLGTGTNKSERCVGEDGGRMWEHRCVTNH